MIIDQNFFTIGKPGQAGTYKPRDVDFQFKLTSMASVTAGDLLQFGPGTMDSEGISEFMDRNNVQQALYGKIAFSAAAWATAGNTLTEGVGTEFTTAGYSIEAGDHVEITGGTNFISSSWPVLVTGYAAGVFTLGGNITSPDANQVDITGNVIRGTSYYANYGVALNSCLAGDLLRVRVQGVVSVGIVHAATATNGATLVTDSLAGVGVLRADPSAYMGSRRVLGKLVGGNVVSNGARVLGTAWFDGIEGFGNYGGVGV